MLSVEEVTAGVPATLNETWFLLHKNIKSGKVRDQ